MKKFKRKYSYLLIILLYIFVDDKNVFCSSEESILETYGVNDLAEIKDFQGGYINFGYWKNINLNQYITSHQRIEASKNLYNLIFEILKVNEKDTVLEVGCGRGNGCVDLLNKIIPQKIWGIDITPQQIQRALLIHSSILEISSKISFKVASSGNLTFPNDSFTKIYSVEAAQCFSSMEKFSTESYRVLKKGGLLVLTAHFSTNEKGYNKVQKLIPTFNKGDRLIPINQVRQSLKAAGFTEIKTFSIGEHVFKGLDKWLEQINAIAWVRNFYKCYKEKDIDYYVIIFRKD